MITLFCGKIARAQRNRLPVPLHAARILWMTVSLLCGCSANADEVVAPAAGGTDPGAGSEADEAFPQAPASTATPSADRDKVRQLIRDVFPDLPKDVLDGWVDTYRDIPPDALKLLLLQKKELGGLLPSGRISAPAIMLPAEQQQAGNPFLLLERFAQQNLANVLTDGYRRRFLRTSVTQFTPDATGLTSTDSATWDLQVGVRYSTDRLFDFAITDNGRCMFCLEPGPVLTRYGRFQRLPDGRLGMQLPGSDKTLRLSGALRIPEDVIDIRIQKGRLRVERASGESSPEQTFELAEIIDPLQLQSRNGVFFRLPKSGAAAVRTKAGNVQVRYLERSNSDGDRELQRLKQIRQISKLQKHLESTDR